MKKLYIEGTESFQTVEIKVEFKLLSIQKIKSINQKISLFFLTFPIYKKSIPRIEETLFCSTNNSRIIIYAKSLAFQNKLEFTQFYAYTFHFL